MYNKINLNNFGVVTMTTTLAALRQSPLLRHTVIESLTIVSKNVSNKKNSATVIFKAKWSPLESAIISVELSLVVIRQQKKNLNVWHPTDCTVTHKIKASGATPGFQVKHLFAVSKEGKVIHTNGKILSK